MQSPCNIFKGYIIRYIELNSRYCWNWDYNFHSNDNKVIQFMIYKKLQEAVKGKLSYAISTIYTVDTGNYLYHVGPHSQDIVIIYYF